MKFERLMENMKAIAEMLIPHCFPKVPVTEEDDLEVLKQREAVIDGYTVMMLYQKADYETHFMKTLQIYSKNNPFLPFSLICKLGKKFLGSDYLSLVEVYKDGRKIYIWNVFTDTYGEAIAPPYDIPTEECHFEGFNYSYLQPSQVSFH